MDIEQELIKEVRCPSCNSLLFKYHDNYGGLIEIACRKCKNLVGIATKIVVITKVIATKNQRHKM